MRAMQVKDIGEFRLIDKLAQAIAAENGSLIRRLDERGFRVRLSIGDDAAAWDAPPGVRVLTTDTMVEGVHFNLGQIGWRDLGWKSLAVNLSDVAAMGGVPKVAVVSLTLDRKASVDFVRKLYAGMQRLAKRFDVALVGGDLSRGRELSLSVALLGDSSPKATVYRTGAKVGDLICVTGAFGGSILGRHLRFMPRIKEGQLLARSGVSSMIDVSDGLLQDLNHLVENSRAAYEIDVGAVPIAHENVIKEA